MWSYSDCQDNVFARVLFIKLYLSVCINLHMCVCVCVCVCPWCICKLCIYNSVSLCVLVLLFVCFGVAVLLHLSIPHVVMYNVLGIKSLLGVYGVVSKGAYSLCYY